MYDNGYTCNDFSVIFVLLQIYVVKMQSVSSGKKIYKNSFDIQAIICKL